LTFAQPLKCHSISITGVPAAIGLASEAALHERPRQLYLLITNVDKPVARVTFDMAIAAL
jgi:hypothetical protein